MSLVSEILDRIPANPPQMVIVTCVSESPFTVYIGGGTTEVPAKRMAGSTFNTGESGYALWRSGTAPICFKTT